MNIDNISDIIDYSVAERVARHTDRSATVDLAHVDIDVDRFLKDWTDLEKSKNLCVRLLIED